MFWFSSPQAQGHYTECNLLQEDWGGECYLCPLHLDNFQERMLNSFGTVWEGLGAAAIALTSLPLHPHSVTLNSNPLSISSIQLLLSVALVTVFYHSSRRVRETAAMHGNYFCTGVVGDVRTLISTSGQNCSIVVSHYFYWSETNLMHLRLLHVSEKLVWGSFILAIQSRFLALS